MSEPRIFINGLGNVSPQRTTPTDSFPFDPLHQTGNQLKSIDPGYRDFIPADQIRRMSRVIRMGIAAAKMCLKDAAGKEDGSTDQPITPDAIITGTGLGCMDDTGKFLATMIRNNEEFLTPTSFIQSTHNTVAGQIALLLQCHGYNFTFVHRALSFESALIDSAMQLECSDAKTILTGASDEITADYFNITSRFGQWKSNPALSNMELLSDHGRGTIAGEGAAFFLLQPEKANNTYASILGAETSLSQPSIESTGNWLARFLERHDLSFNDIDLIISGMNGDAANDRVYLDLAGSYFPSTSMGYYKHLCGEYQTSAAFATWLASRILASQSVPGYILRNHKPDRLKNILIYNHYHSLNHGAILLTAE